MNRLLLIFVILVGSLPTWAQTILPSATIGAAYSDQIGSFSSPTLQGQLPPGLSFQTSFIAFGQSAATVVAGLQGGTVSLVGTPTIAGTYQFSIVDKVLFGSMTTAYSIYVGTTTGGQFTYVSSFGSFGTGNGQFSGAQDVALDTSGNVYVLDAHNNRVEKFGSSGTYLSQFGSSGSGPGQFSYPAGIAIDANDNIYVVDNLNNRVEEFNSSGAFVSQFGSSGSGNGQFNSPGGIVIDPSGYIYVVDNSNDRVQKFNSSGVYISQIAALGSGLRGIGTDASGNVYITQASLNVIYIFNSSGTQVAQFGSPGSGNGQLSLPSGVATDPSGNIYVADTGNNRVQVFSSSGLYVSQFGTPGSGNGQFNTPGTVAINSGGSIYVTDDSNNRVQIWSGAAAAVSAITPQNGWWWNASEGGRGYGIEVENGRIYMAAYMYRSDGTPVWYVGDGAFTNGSFTGPLLQYLGSETLESGPPNTNSSSTTAANVTVTFTSATQGTIDWSNGPFTSPTVTSITRYPINGSTITAASLMGAPQTGWWWNPNESGTGYFIEQQGSQIFMTAYMYGSNQNDIWYYAQGVPIASSGGPFGSSSGVSMTAALEQASGGQTLTSGPMPIVSTSSSGQITLQCASATSCTLTLPSGRQVALSRFTSF